MNHGPLRLIIAIAPSKHPRVPESILQIYNSHQDVGAGSWAGVMQPERIALSCYLIQSELADKPADYRRDSSRQHQPTNPGEGSPSEIGRSLISLAGASKSNGLESIDKAQQDEEYGEP